MSNAAVTSRTTHIGLRLPNELLAEIDEYRGEFTRTEIIRALLRRGLGVYKPVDRDIRATRSTASTRSGVR